MLERLVAIVAFAVNQHAQPEKITAALGKGIRLVAIVPGTAQQNPHASGGRRHEAETVSLADTEKMAFPVTRNTPRKRIRIRCAADVLVIPRQIDHDGDVSRRQGCADFLIQIVATGIDQQQEMPAMDIIFPSGDSDRTERRVPFQGLRRRPCCRQLRRRLFQNPE